MRCRSSCILLLLAATATGARSQAQGAIQFRDERSADLGLQFVNGRPVVTAPVRFFGAAEKDLHSGSYCFRGFEHRGGSRIIYTKAAFNLSGLQFHRAQDRSA
jgi:hypothetical protein